MPPAANCSSTNFRRMGMTEQLAGGRFLAITSIIRLNQIEVAHDRFIGEDEQDMVSLDNARRFRETIRALSSGRDNMGVQLWRAHQQA